MSTETQTGWNSFARTNASDRWRKPSAMMGTPLTDFVVKESLVERGMRVLDVASGTGEPAISIANLLDGTGEVVATDISPGPLKIAEGRAQQRGLRNIRFQISDVHALPFDNASFDRVTSRLGLMFFGELPKALREIRRVLKPGGRFTAVVWGPMQQPYFETTVGTILKLFPDLQLPASGAAMFKFGETGTLARALREAGFSKANDGIHDIEWSWPGSAQEVWEYFQAVTIPFAPLFKAVPDTQRERVKQEVIAAILRYKDGEKIRFQGRFTLATAE